MQLLDSCRAFGFLLFLCPCSLLHDDTIQTSAFSIAECFSNGSKETGVILITMSLVVSLNMVLGVFVRQEQICLRKG